jgi:hypothetical protein
MPEPFASRFIGGIDANRTVKDELSAALARKGTRRRVAVTDLVNPRQAYFRWTHPEIQPSPEKLQTMLAGTGFHELFGRAVSTEEYVEQFVEVEGVVGKIDIFDDAPVELKTSRSIPADIPLMRPSYLDQLGLYCAMTRKPAGRLLLYKRAEFGRTPELKAYDVAFADLDAIGAEMIRRRDLFRDALDRRDPAALPQCEWWGRACDYGAICGCDRAPASGHVVPREAARLAENAELAASLAERLREPFPARPGFGLNDLVFPRKAAFEKRPAAAEGADRESEDESRQDSTVETRLRSLERQGFGGALYQALRFGVPGAFTRVPVEVRSLKGLVGMYKDMPTILRTTKFREMVDRSRLAESFPHYFDRIAFECALAGLERGRVVIYYERIPGDKFMVYDVRFRDLDAVAAEADRRLELLESGAPPAELPPCPSWMAKFCPFAPGCACGGA